MQSEFIRSNCHDAPVFIIPIWDLERKDVVVCTACREIMGVITPTSQFEKDALWFHYWWMLVGSSRIEKLSDYIRITGV